MEQTKTRLRTAIKQCGGVRHLAHRIGYTRQTVYRWLDQGVVHLPELAEYRYQQAMQERKDAC